MSKIVLVPITHGTEEMEAVTIIDLLRRAGISVKVVSDKEIVKCSRGIKILPDILFEDLDIDAEYDAIIIPGGSEGTQELIKNEYLTKILHKAKSDGKLIGAICAAPLILDTNKLVERDAKLTSHPSVKYALEKYNYEINDVVEFENIITSRAAGTAIVFTLKVIERLLGRNVAQKVSQEILYHFPDDYHQINE